MSRLLLARQLHQRPFSYSNLPPFSDIIATPVAATPSNAFYKNEVLERYGAISTKLVTLRQLTVFGRRLTLEKLLKSGNYLRTELPVRLAHRIREFQNLPFIIGMNPHIHAVYELYWDAFEKLRSVPALHSLEDNEAFCALVKRMLSDHLVVIPQLAWGMAQSYSHMPESDSDRFMTDTLKSRIGRRVLAEQHLALSESWEAHHGDHDLGRWIGLIDTACLSEKIVQKCSQKAAAHIQEAYGVRPPDVLINGHLDAEFLYIPDHIEYILFEVIKNSMQATLKKHAESGKFPPILVTIGQHQTSVVFRVSDQGGGIDSAIQKSVFSFAQGARRNLDNFVQIPKMAAKMNEPSRLFSLGLSMAMSKVYSNYWGGNLHFMCMDGFGTDIYLTLSVGNQQENIDGNDPAFESK